MKVLSRSKVAGVVVVSALAVAAGVGVAQAVQRRRASEEANKSKQVPSPPSGSSSSMPLGLILGIGIPFAAVVVIGALWWLRRRNATRRRRTNTPPTPAVVDPPPILPEIEKVVAPVVQPVVHEIEKVVAPGVQTQLPEKPPRAAKGAHVPPPGMRAFPATGTQWEMFLWHFEAELRRNFPRVSDEEIQKSVTELTHDLALPEKQLREAVQRAHVAYENALIDTLKRAATDSGDADVQRLLANPENEEYCRRRVRQMLTLGSFSYTDGTKFRLLKGWKHEDASKAGMGLRPWLSRASRRVLQATLVRVQTTYASGYDTRVRAKSGIRLIYHGYAPFQVFDAGSQVAATQVFTDRWELPSVPPEANKKEATERVKTLLRAIVRGQSGVEYYQLVDQMNARDIGGSARTKLRAVYDATQAAENAGRVASNAINNATRDFEDAVLRAQARQVARLNEMDTTKSDGGAIVSAIPDAGIRREIGGMVTHPLMRE